MWQRHTHALRLLRRERVDRRGLRVVHDADVPAARELARVHLVVLLPGRPLLLGEVLRVALQRVVHELGGVEELLAPVDHLPLDLEPDVAHQRDQRVEDLRHAAAERGRRQVDDALALAAARPARGSPPPAAGPRCGCSRPGSCAPGRRAEAKRESFLLGRPQISGYPGCSGATTGRSPRRTDVCRLPTSRGQHQRERRPARPSTGPSARPSIVPASSRAIASPSPAPCAPSSDEKNGSKMCGMLWRLMPRPRVGDLEPDMPVLAGRRNHDRPCPRACGRARCRAGSASPGRRARGRTRARSGRAPVRSSSCGAVLGERAGANSPATAAREGADVGRLGPQLERAGLQPREVEQLGRELAQARRPGRAPGRGTGRAWPRRAPRPRAARGSRRARRSACAARARPRR